MKGHLSLVTNEFENTQKRVLPRFPFSTMTFKDMDESKVYEVHDISSIGMQVSLKSGSLSHQAEEEIRGELHWKQSSLEVVGKIQSINDLKIKVEFVKDPFFEKRLKSFLSLENIINGLKALHDPRVGIELPANLKYWLRSDGPVELFIWQHKDREMSKFQFLVFENFIEWNDGDGIQTGTVQSQRDIETPLMEEDEFLFSIDEHADKNKIDLAREIVCSLPKKLVPEDILEFLKVKTKAS